MNTGSYVFQINKHNNFLPALNVRPAYDYKIMHLRLYQTYYYNNNATFKSGWKSTFF